MPYISKEDRDHIDENLLLNLSFNIKNVPSGKSGGALNYTICKLALQALRPKDGWSYTSLSNVINHIQRGADEIKRRMLDPYEDGAIENNGDLEEFKL